MGPFFLRLTSFHFRPKFLRKAAQEALTPSKIYQMLTKLYLRKIFQLKGLQKRCGVPIYTLKDRVRGKVDAFKSCPSSMFNL